jgi:hypothetical protein
MSSPSERLTRSNTSNERSVWSILLDSTVEAAWRAFILIVLGNLAVSLVGGIFQDMTPSLPPGIAGTEAPSHGRPQWHWSSDWLHREAFLPIFGLVFAGIVWVRLRRKPTDAGASPRARRVGKRLRKVQRVLRDEWFGLLVWNAFGAMAAAMVATLLPRFSLVQWMFEQALGLMGLPFHQLIESISGERGASMLDAWVGWYGHNQLQLAFWFFYFAGICDDLGLPNIKTLGRRLWRSMRTRGRALGQQSRRPTRPTA